MKNINKYGWKVKKLGEICEFFTDGNWIESKDQSEEGIRLLQTGNIGVGKFEDKEAKSRYISECTFEKLNCTEVFPSDCLISRLPEPVGRACLVPDLGVKMITAVDCTIARFKEEIQPEFFIHYTQSGTYRNNVLAYLTGTTRKRISRGNLFNIPIPIPPLSTQSAIVAELDSLHRLKGLQEQQLEEYDKLAQSTFYSMFGDPIENDKGWEVKKLGEICDVRDGTHDSPKYQLEGFPLITSKNIVSGKISFDNVNLISKEDFDAINKRSKVDFGDILMPMIGTIGNPVINDTNKEFAIKNVALIKCTNSKEKLNLYIKYTLDSPSFKEEYSKLILGGTQKFLSLGIIRNLEIPISPFSLQFQFAQRIEKIETQKELVKQSIAQTEQLINYTMDKYFG